MPKDFRYFVKPKSIESSLVALKSRSSVYWEKLGEKKVLDLANFAFKSVPAYGRYLKDNGFQSSSVESMDAFKRLPLTSKHDYLKKYTYKDLFPDGYLDKITTISSTSGSTGEPFYFPRGEEQDLQYEYVAEIFLKNQFDIDKYRTLGIIGFGLGIWIGGMFTYKNLNRIASKGYRLALAPVGTNKEIFLKTFAKMAPLFEQVILMGYPPFIRDVIDESESYGIDWKKHRIKVLNATEGYSEKFREYLIRKLRLKSRYKDVINIYGSVELGTMSHETSLANLIRKIAVEDKDVFKVLFPGAVTTPTLAQYYPYMVYFEEVGGEVVASGLGSSFPLLRYRFHDQGGVISFNDMLTKLDSVGVDILKEAKKHKIHDTVLKLPFVYIYGRSDFVVILRGANIYPENIKDALSEKELDDCVTGKFTMLKREDDRLEEYLEVNVELRKGVKGSPDLLKMVTDVVTRVLRERNSEYNYLYTTEGGKLAPKVILHDYGSSKYFGVGIKQRWVAE